MTSDADALSQVFEQIQRGDIEGGRARLVQICSSPNCSLDALCLAANEHMNEPERPDVVSQYARTIRSRFPKSGANGTIAFLHDPANMRVPDSVMAFVRSMTDEPAQGPHEAALRLMGRLAATNLQLLIMSARTGAGLRGTVTDVSLIGFASLRCRDADKALVNFTQGASRPEDTAENFKNYLAADYSSARRDKVLSHAQLINFAGAMLAFRELGQHDEAIVMMERVKVSTTQLDYLLRPLLDEVMQRRGQGRYSSQWRAGFMQRLTSQRRAEASEAPKSSGCALAMTVLLGSAASTAATWLIT